MRDRSAEGFQFLVGGLEFRSAYSNSLFQFLVELANLLFGPLALNRVADRARQDTAFQINFGDVILCAILDHR